MITRLNGYRRNGRHVPADQMPPSDLDAERSVLACMMFGRDDERLSADRFYSDPHRKIFGVLSEMRGEGVPIDTVTLGHELERRGLFADVGGAPYILQILETVPHADHLPYYAEIVLEKWYRRYIISKAEEVRRGAYAGRPLSELVEQIQSIDLCDHHGSITAAELVKRHPYLRPPVVDGLLREGETANVVAATKAGKSWLIHDLALAVATGSRWLDTFNCTAGGVLIIDNELHPETLAHRLRSVAEARGIRLEDVGDALRVESLRGNWQDVYAMADRMCRLKRPPKLVLLDALYRMLPNGTNENDNGALTAVHNAMERLPQRLGCALAAVCHNPKGDVSGRSVADLVAGAGSQSRAVDSQISLRPHEEDGCAVLEAITRSFPCPDPLGLRWTYPVWSPAADVDPARLATKRTGTDQHQRNRDSEADRLVLEHATTWRSRTALSTATGIGCTRLNRAIARLVSGGYLERSEQEVHGNHCEAFRKSIRAK